MGNKNNQEKFRKLSITSLITGILTYICVFPMYLLLEWGELGKITGPIIYLFLFYLFLLGLPIAAIVCGSIDLIRIIRGQCSSKGKGFDIAGIILGSVFIFAVIYLVMIDLVDKINREGEPLH